MTLQVTPVTQEEIDYAINTFDDVFLYMYKIKLKGKDKLRIGDKVCYLNRIYHKSGEIREIFSEGIVTKKYIEKERVVAGVNIGDMIDLFFESDQIKKGLFRALRKEEI